MSPTRRDILTLSAGVVAAALVSPPVVAYAEASPTPRLVGMYLDLSAAKSLADVRVYLVEQDSTGKVTRRLSEA